MALLNHQTVKVLLERSQNIGLIRGSLHPCNCVDLQYEDRSELTSLSLILVGKQCSFTKGFIYKKAVLIFSDGFRNRSSYIIPHTCRGDYNSQPLAKICTKLEMAYQFRECLAI